MTYSEKLRDPRWQRKRLQIFERDNWTCLFCGANDKNLQCHHVVYRKIDPWAYPDYLYQTACDDCHSKRTEITDKLIDSLRITLKDIPTERLERCLDKLMAAAMEEI